jgi:iron complex outermembrane recepter protein
MAKRTHGGALAAAAAALALTPTVYAAQAEPRTMAIEEIIVTAQRRDESLQRVPIAVTAFDTEALEVNQIRSIDEIAMRTPGLVSTPRNPAQPLYFIRGIGSNLIDAGAEASVVVFIDDVYIGRGGGMNFDLFDLERVEVLRGPQGTLFGRNVVGGLIHVVSRKPTEETTARIQGVFGNYDRLNLNASFGGALTEQVFANFAVSSTERDGYVRNATSGNRLFNENNRAARGQLRFVPNDRLDVLLSADVTRDRTNGDPRKVLGIGDERDISSPDPLTVEAREDGFQNRDLWGASLNVQYDTGFGDLTSITAYRSLDYSFLSDFLGVPVTPATIGSLNWIDEESFQFTQELRLAGTAMDERLDWVTGAFYIREDTERLDLLQQDFDAATGGAAIGLSGQVAFPQENVTDGYAIFGEVTWHASDRLRLTAGARQSWDRKRVHLQGIDVTQTGLPLKPPPLQQEFDIRSSERWDAFTPRFAISYDLTDDVMLYTSAARGYKSGGYQGIPTNGLSASTPYDPEYAWSYEVGVKSQFWDNRAQLNLTGFFTDYTDLQVSQLIGADQVVVGNAADAEVKGIEVEWAAVLTPNLRFTGSYGYLDATFETFDAPPASGGDLSGNRLSRSPKNKLNLAMQYEARAFADWNVLARVDWSYTDEFFFDPRNRVAPAGGDRQGSYDLLDARLALVRDDGSLELALWGKNLTDELYKTYIGVFAPFNQAFVTFGVPRTYGATVTWSM